MMLFSTVVGLFPLLDDTTFLLELLDKQVNRRIFVYIDVEHAGGFPATFALWRLFGFGWPLRRLIRLIFIRLGRGSVIVISLVVTRR